MKFRLKITSILLLISVCYSCSDDDSENNLRQNQTIIFGWFGDGLCNGDCTSIYKLEDNKVYRDIDYADISNMPFQGNFQEMENANFQDYVGLINQLPNDIFNEPNGYLGCVDCTDEVGGLYVEYDVNGETKIWKIRNGQSPDYVQTYRSLILDKLADLNSL